jgi:ABC-type uncharacterized transport system permease subunit
MILIFQPRPIRILGTAVVFGYEGASLLATGIPAHAENQIIAGTVFAILAVAAAFYGLRWAWRFVRAFFR